MARNNTRRYYVRVLRWNLYLQSARCEVTHESAMLLSSGSIRFDETWLASVVDAKNKHRDHFDRIMDRARRCGPHTFDLQKNDVKNPIGHPDKEWLKLDIKDSVDPEAKYL